MTVIAVCGAGEAGQRDLARAEETGRLLASAGAVLVCGGLGGVMDAAAKGARAAGGAVIGILPGPTRAGASEHLSVAIPTGLGEGRNALVVRAADAVIAIGGEFGTLSEIALALKMGKPVVGLDTWRLAHDGRTAGGAGSEPDPIARAATPEEAVAMALAAARG